MVKIAIFLVLLAASTTFAQQQDCKTQLGQALTRMGTAQDLAKADREAIIAYFQDEIRKKMFEIEQLQKQLEEKGKEEKN